MSCKKVQERISLLLDQRLQAGERENVLAHMESCRECGAYFETLAEHRTMLRSMAQPLIPEELSAKLHVLASHERERVTLSARLQQWASRVQLTFDNLMRPVALPFTGGILSALVLFAVLVPSLSFSHDITGQEFYTVPIGSIVTNPSGQIGDPDADFPRIALPSEPTQDYMNVVDLTIDENGRVVDWSVVRGQLTEDMKSVIVLSRFQPATAFGVPTSAKIRVVQSCPSATVHG